MRKTWRLRHNEFLLRTSAGGFKIEDAVTLQEMENGGEKYLLPEETAVMHLPELVLTDRQAWRITQGVATSMAEAADGLYRLKGRSGEFSVSAKPPAE